MNVLKNILKEIEEKKFSYEQTLKCEANEKGISEMQNRMSELKLVEEIIQSHMDEVPKCGDCSRRKWYQKGYRDGKNISAERIKTINNEMGEYLFQKYCIEGFDEELDKIFNKYLGLAEESNI